MNPEKLLLLLIVTLLSPIVIIAGLNTWADIERERMRNEHKLQEYKLVTERTEAEAKLIYAKALEISCTSELVNKWGEVYSR